MRSDTQRETVRRELLPRGWKLCAGLGLAACVVAWMGCGGDRDASVSASGVGQEAKGAEQQKLPWPGLDPNAPPVALAEDLLAVNYYVILDGSGSMKGNECAGSQSKARAAKDALADFVQAMPSDVNVGLLAFDGQGISERLPLGVRDVEAFRRSVAGVGAELDTPLQSALTEGYRALTKQARSQLGYGEYNLVIVTDGEASRGEDPTPIVRQILRESPVLIHTIGFCIDERHVLNQAGRTIYRGADNPEELRAGLGAVLAEAPSFDVSEF